MIIHFSKLYTTLWNTWYLNKQNNIRQEKIDELTEQKKKKKKIRPHGNLFFMYYINGIDKFKNK